MKNKLGSERNRLGRDEFINRLKQVLLPEAYFFVGTDGAVYAETDSYCAIELACFMDDGWIMKKSINTKEEEK